ncbi:MAG TPA: hypothetical protein EYN87_09495, partial [Gammaproteobacteria bacterium]|nr:hypothetical protein [Gammaproteobacteria bacterium]
HSRLLETAYQVLEAVLNKLHPLWNLVGYERIEPYFQFVERLFKTLLFDCQMCGECLLGSTGMSCPMNCPKELRNGPCGGVREGGNCEVIPDMRCVWVDAWEGAKRMQDQSGIQRVQPPLANGIRGRSSWLREVRMKRLHGLQPERLER